MTTKRHAPMVRSSATLALVLILMLVITACDSGSPATGSTPITQGTSGAASTIPAGKGGALGTNTPQVSQQPNSKLDCQTLADTASDFNSRSLYLITLVGSGGSVVNRVDQPFYVDTAKLRADLNILAVLPDPTDAAEASILGKPSEAIPQWRELLDTVDKASSAGATSAGTPSATSSTKSNEDQQLLAFTAKIAKMSSAINNEMGHACPGVSANVPQPGQQPTPLPASYQIGQTASVGDLRVTLDKVVTTQGTGSLLPTSGNHFVFVYITLENTGKNSSNLNAMTNAHFEDAFGKQYSFDTTTIMLDSNTTNLDGGIEPGAKKSGPIGYQLPTNAGDLVWVFQDYKPNRAVFTVKAGDIGPAGTPVTEPTEDSLRAQAAATQTAFLGMALSAVATQEAEPTQAPDPTQEVEPTQTSP